VIATVLRATPARAVLQAADRVRAALAGPEEAREPEAQRRLLALAEVIAEAPQVHEPDEVAWAVRTLADAGVPVDQAGAGLLPGAASLDRLDDAAAHALLTALRLDDAELAGTVVAVLPVPADEAALRQPSSVFQTPRWLPGAPVLRLQLAGRTVDVTLRLAGAALLVGVVATPVWVLTVNLAAGTVAVVAFGAAALLGLLGRRAAEQLEALQLRWGVPGVGAALVGPDTEPPLVVQLDADAVRAARDWLATADLSDVRDSRPMVEQALTVVHALMAQGVAAGRQAELDRALAGPGFEPPAQAELEAVEGALRRHVVRFGMLRRHALDAAAQRAEQHERLRLALTADDLTTLQHAAAALRDVYAELRAELAQAGAADGLPGADTPVTVTSLDVASPWSDPDHQLDPYLRQVLRRRLTEQPDDPDTLAVATQLRALTTWLGRAVTRLRLLGQEPGEVLDDAALSFRTLVSDAVVRVQATADVERRLAMVPGVPGGAARVGF
jgi:hypothetical protein